MTKVCRKSKVFFLTICERWCFRKYKWSSPAYTVVHFSSLTHGYYCWKCFNVFLLHGGVTHGYLKCRDWARVPGEMTVHNTVLPPPNTHTKLTASKWSMRWVCWEDSEWVVAAWSGFTSWERALVLGKRASGTRRHFRNARPCKMSAFFRNLELDKPKVRKPLLWKALSF